MIDTAPSLMRGSRILIGTKWPLCRGVLLLSCVEENDTPRGVEKYRRPGAFSPMIPPPEAYEKVQN